MRRHARSLLCLVRDLACVFLVLGAAADWNSRPAGFQARAAEPTSTTVPFRFETRRVLLLLDALTPDRRTRPVLAWLNMGVPKAVLSPELYRDLGIGRGEPLRLRLGDMPLDMAATDVQDGAPELGGENAFAHLFAPVPVDAVLPAGALRNYEVVLDYAARRLTLARPGTLKPQGIATPFRLNDRTGVIAVDAAVGGEAHALAIDAGAGFTWLRGDVVGRWLSAHPDWLRVRGAVGPSNMGMVDLAFEQQGLLVRIPELTIALRLRLHDVNALGTAPLLCSFCDRIVGNLFWDAWAKNAPEPVVGWLGNDLLSDFRLTIDYPNRTLYWRRQHPDVPREIDQVGLTLVRRHGGYFVGGVAIKDGRPTVEGASAGDKLVAIDGRDPQNAPSDDVLAALGGSAGTHHVITLERGTLSFDVDCVVAAF